MQLFCINSGVGRMRGNRQYSWSSDIKYMLSTIILLRRLMAVSAKDLDIILQHVYRRDFVLISRCEFFG